MLPVAAMSPETVHAARACACSACKFVVRRAEESVLTKLTFDLSYDAFRRTDAAALTVPQ